MALNFFGLGSGWPAPKDDIPVPSGVTEPAPDPEPEPQKPAPPVSSEAIPPLPPAEPDFERLQQENQRLLEALSELVSRCTGGDGPKVTELSEVKLEVMGPDGKSITDVAKLLEALHARKEGKEDRGVVRSDDPASVLVVAPLEGDGEGEGEQVAVLDVDPDAYWVMVEHPNDDGETGAGAGAGGTSKARTGSSSSSGEGKKKRPADRKKEVPMIEADGLGGEGYEMVKDEELVHALAEYVLHSIKKIPEAKRLPAESLKTVLETAFAGLRTPTAMARLWDWGIFAYTSYSYARVAYALYKEPAMLRIVVTGVYKLGKWALLFCL